MAHFFACRGALTLLGVLLFLAPLGLAHAESAPAKALPDSFALGKEAYLSTSLYFGRHSEGLFRKLDPNQQRIECASGAIILGTINELLNESEKYYSEKMSAGRVGKAILDAQARLTAFKSTRPDNAEQQASWRAEGDRLVGELREWEKGFFNTPLGQQRAKLYAIGFQHGDLVKAHRPRCDGLLNHLPAEARSTAEGRWKAVDDAEQFLAGWVDIATHQTSYAPSMARVRKMFTGDENFGLPARPEVDPCSRDERSARYLRFAGGTATEADEIFEANWGCKD